MNEKLLLALIGAGSALLGSCLGIVGQFGLAFYRDWSERRKDEPRRKLLRTMLADSRYEWPKLETLQHVIGADESTTKRLLLEVEARASENGTDVWGLISRHSLGSEDA